MRKIVLAAVLIFGIQLAGCALVESAFGIKQNPVTGQKESDGTGGVAGSILNILIPGAGMVVTSLAAAYVNAKRKQWKNAAVATFAGVEAFGNTEIGEAVVDKLKATLASHHTGAKILPFVDAVLSKEGINKPQ